MCDEPGTSVIVECVHAARAVVPVAAGVAVLAAAGWLVAAVVPFLPAVLAAVYAVAAAGLVVLWRLVRQPATTVKVQRRNLNKAPADARKLALPAPPLAIEAPKPVMRLVPAVVPENERISR
jgi:hypothetical protein